LEYYKYAITSREIFDLENKKDPATLTDIQRVTLKYSIGKSAASREKERAEVLIQNY
jgi:hypothetical protein